MKIESSAFNHSQSIPEKYTCDGKNINPPLKITDFPDKTKSFVLIMDDPDIPEAVKQARGIVVFDHWIVYNIHPQTSEIKEGVEPNGNSGFNSADKIGYTGPCPPDKEHRYFFKLYALDTELTFVTTPTKENIETEMQNHILEKAELIGLYNRVKNQ